MHKESTVLSFCMYCTLQLIDNWNGKTETEKNRNLNNTEFVSVVLRNPCCSFRMSDF